MRISIITSCLLFLLVTFNLVAADYYWVGGSGNWSEISHWVTSSGGTTTYIVIPGSNDNVFFDSNSFPIAGCTVTINTNAVCNNMSWLGTANNPSLSGNNNLRIYGSLSFISNINIYFTGQISFEATTAGKTITCSGQKFNSDVIFQGIGGAWTLLDSLITAGTLYLNAGSLNTNNQYINASSFMSSSVDSRALNLGSSVLDILNTWVITTVNFSFNAGSSVINMTEANATMNSGNGIKYNDIEFSNPDGISYIDGASTVRNMTFMCSGRIYDNRTYNNLTLSPGKQYEIQAASVQTILSNLNVPGTCASPVTIMSNSDGSYAEFNKSGAAITISYTLLKDIHVTGSAAFTANNSIDLGNNTGWTINSPSPLNLYWVGGSGNWNESQHWSYSSGGAGGACVPSPLDNVFFDANSFSAPNQTVNINIINATCNNMNWSGSQFNPILDGPQSSNLRIYGSLNFTSTMNLNFQGQIYFEAKSTGKTITTGGQVFKNIVNFKGIGGGWTFLDDFSSQSNIEFVNGTLNTNSKNVSCWSFNSNYSNTRSLSLGSSQVTVADYWSLYSPNLTFDAGTSYIKITQPNSSMYAGEGLTYYNVEFSSTEWYSYLYYAANFNTMTFRNSGRIYNDNTFNRLVLSPGKIYEINNSTTQIINNSLDAAGQCNGMIFIKSMNSGLYATISKSGSSITCDYLILKDIHKSGGASFIANNSVDCGNNTGWTINSITPRNLYWVGGSGYWNDISHWSLSSGGIAGECSPTPLDNVLFDGSSFNATEQVVNLNISFATCKNMDWSGTLFNPALQGSQETRLMLYGSLNFIPQMDNQFPGIVRFEATSAGNTINPAGKSFNNDVYFSGLGGSWTLQDSLNIQANILYEAGSLTTNNKNISCLSFSSSTNLPRSLSLGSSTITLADNWFIIPDNLILNPGNSNIIFTNLTPIMNSGNGLRYHNVGFVNSGGTMTLEDSAFYNNFLFLGSGIINNENFFDTLSFSPGKIYELVEKKTQKIGSQFNIRGSNCFRIILRSQGAGSQAIISKNGSAVSGDFIEMRDIAATGTSTFYAGNFSNNISNNSGWVFSNAPGYIYGLGPDVSLCPGESLQTNNFNGAERYLWQDGSTDSTYTITQPGTYWVTAFYADNCTYTDTIVVTLKPAPKVFAGNDTIICEGSSSIKLNPTVSGCITPYTYRWEPATGLSNPNIANPIANPSVPTKYILSVTGANGCTGIDTINIIVGPPADIQFVGITDSINFPVVCKSKTIDTVITIINLSDISTNLIAESTPAGLFSLDANPMLITINPKSSMNIHLHCSGNQNEGSYYGVFKMTDPCGNVDSLVLKVEIFEPKISLPDTLNFGTVCANSNNNENLAIRNVSSRGTSFIYSINSPFFTLAGNPFSSPFEVNESRSITVNFNAPDSTVTITDSLMIIDTCGGIKSLILTADVFKPLVLLPDSIDFGTICLNTIKDTTFKLTNLTPLATSFSYNISQPSLFSITSNPFSSPFAPLESRNISLRFDGSPLEGTFSEKLDIIDTCGSVHRIYLTAEIISPELINTVPILLIDSVEIGTKKTGTVVFFNNSKSVLSIDSIESMIFPFSIVATTPPLPADIFPGDSLVIDIEFSSMDASSHTTIVNVRGSVPCSFSDSSIVIGSGIPASASASVYIQSDSAYPGENINLPLMLQSSNNLIQSGTNSFTAKISMNRTILKPTFTSVSQEIKDDIRTIEISGSVSDTSGKLSDLWFVAALGDSECTPIIIDTLIWVNSNCTTQKQKGIFCLKGICKEGGTRLFTLNTNKAYLRCMPNPAQNTLAVDFGIIEKGNVEISITDLIGKNSLTFINKEIFAGTYSYHFDVTSLASGSYILRMFTGTKDYHVIISIVK